MGRATRIAAAIILASMTTTGCGGKPPSYFTTRGMAVYNINGKCNQERVQQWEDEAISRWEEIQLADHIESVGAELHCLDQELFDISVVEPDGSIKKTTTDAHQRGNNIYLGTHTSYARTFLHEFSHWILVFHSDIPNSPYLHHMLFDQLQI